MRKLAGFGVPLLITMALWAPAGAAAAGDAQGALAEAHAALAAQPPQRDAARRALERAAAAEDPDAAGEAYYRLGILDEEDDELSRALTDYRRSLGAKSVTAGGAFASEASKRMQWLAVRSEGNYAPLKRLNRFKRDHASSAEAEAIAALARDAEAFPPGIVRAEARVIVATAWLGPLHRVHDAVSLFRQVATDPTADGAALTAGRRGLVDALLADGHLDEAAKEIDVYASELDPDVVSRLQVLVRRRRVLFAARIAFGTFLVLAAVALGYARRKQGSLRDALRATGTSVRVAGVIGCVAGVTAAVFVLLGALAPAYLEHIGL